MSASAELVYEKIKALPPQRLAEVADFVDFLQVRDENLRVEAGLRLGLAMDKLDALNLPSMSTDEVQAEINASRADQRASANADRR